MHLDGSNLHQVAQSLPETAWPSWSITDSPAPTATPTQAAASNGGHLARLRSRTLQQTAQTSQVIDYEYDGLFRLTSATYCPVADYATDARLYQYIYGYDLRGNRLSLDVSGSNTVASHEGFTYDLANRIISRTVSGVSDPINYTYDVYNLTSDGQNNYSYDRANRLLSATSSTTATSYRYNGLGERYQQTVNASQTTTYLPDLAGNLSQVLRESIVCLPGATCAAPNAVTWYMPGIGQQTEGQDWRFDINDALGSIRGLTDLNAQMLYSTSYDPFGNPVQQSGVKPSLGFAGEYTDSNSLIYLRARYYNPSIGAFLTHDPVEGMMDRLGSRNGYTYAEGNPVNLTDPSGKFAPLLFAGLVALLGGLTFGGIPAALEWRIAHDCQCGDPSVRNADPLVFVAGRTAVTTGVVGVAGLALTAWPWLALPIALGGTGLSAWQAGSYWNPSNPWETFKRFEGILGTVVGLATLPSAAAATSDALLGAQLSKLAATDALFHPDVVYPQVQRGLIGQFAEGILSRFGFYLGRVGKL